MGLGTERHDTMSQETHAGQWLGFRQPVLRVAREKRGEQIVGDLRSQSGRSLGRERILDRAELEDRSGRLARHPQVLRVARTAPAQPITMDEYYGWMFEHSVPGLAGSGREGEPDAAAVHAEVRRVPGLGQDLQPRARAPARRRRAAGRPRQGDTVVKDGAAVGVVVDGVARAGFNTPSRKLEFYSPTLAEWGWPEHAVPRYVPGPRALARSEARRGGVRSAAELPAADAHPHALAGEVAVRDLARQPAVDLDRRTRARYGIATGDLVKVRTRIGYFVTRAWVTEGIRPGVLGMSHHLGRWRLQEDSGRRRAPRRRSCGSRAKATAATRCAGARRPAVRERRPGQPAASGGAKSACTRT